MRESRDDAQRETDGREQLMLEICSESGGMGSMDSMDYSYSVIAVVLCWLAVRWLLSRDVGSDRRGGE